MKGDNFMKKKCLFALVFISVNFLMTAQSASETGHNLSLGASVGLLAGRTEEILYVNSVSKNKASQLLWDMKPLVYAGADIHYNYQPPVRNIGIFSDVSFKCGFPGKTGVMEDRDWVMVYYPNWLTHYSVHDNKTERAILVDAKAGPSFTVLKNYRLKFFISYSFMQFSYTGIGGSILYPDWPPLFPGEHDYFPPSLKGITYEQTWNMLSLGLSFYSQFNRYFDIELLFSASPFIWCSAKDQHLLRDLVINSTMLGGISFEPGLLFSFKPHTLFALALSFTYRNISGTRGYSDCTGSEIYEEYGRQKVRFNNVSGAGYSVFDIGIVIQYKLF